MASARRISGLYAVTPELDDDQALLSRVEQALLGGTRIIQYRDKSASAERALRRARALRALCDRHASLLIVNDHVELAAQVGADGVHLGREDADLAAARARLGGRSLIGLSCYDDLGRARAARDAGADYVAFGSVFASGVKPGAVRAPLDLFRRARREMTLPLVAIGGIDVHNAPAVLAAGAHAIAVITALFGAPDVTARAREFSQLFSPDHSCSTT